MPVTTKIRISKDLASASMAFINAKNDPEIAPVMAGVGCDGPHLDDCNAVLTDTNAQVTRQVALVGAYETACAAAEAAKHAAHGAFQDLAQTCRAVLAGDKAALATLGLNRQMPRPVSELITMGMALFDNALATPSIAAVIARAGYAEARLQEGRATFLALIQAVRAQAAARGAAQQATAEQNAAMKTLRQELSRFRRLAKVALRGKPQLLEKLGILVRSAPTEAQRKAAKKAAETRKTKKATAKADAKAQPKEPGEAK